MTIAYVVSETGFEYNDEIYRASDDDSGTTVHVFRSQIKALAHATKLTCEKLKSENLEYYGYSVDEIFDDIPEAQRILDKYDSDFSESLPDISWDGYKTLSKLLQNMADEDIKALADTLSINFYHVYPVEIDDAE